MVEWFKSIVKNMKGRNRYKILSLFLVVLAGTILVGWADTLEQIKKNKVEIKTIRGDFVQEKNMKILSNPFVSKGVFYYKIPNSFRWEYYSPIISIMLMHKGRTKRFIKTNTGFTEDVGANFQAVQGIIQELMKWFNGRFDENPDFKVTLQDGGKIVMVPKKKSYGLFVQHIELILSEKPGVIKSIMIYESEDAFTKFEFINVRLNGEIQDSLFREIK